MNFRIAWVNTENGRSGCGKKLLTNEEAEALCAELNRDYPAIEHRVEYVGSVADCPTPEEALEQTNMNPQIPLMTDEDPFPFGKYKGQKIKDVPSWYLDWLYDQPWAKRWIRVMEYIERTRKSINQDIERKERE